MIRLEPGQLACVDCNALPWTPSTFASGLSVRDAAIAGGLELQFVRMEPGARIPLHAHELPEFIYVLEGELHVAGRTIGAGWASIAAPGSEHRDVHTETGCTFLLVDQPV
ncbi:MAG: cupin domain-containing protein [Thermomonas sp.]